MAIKKSKKRIDQQIPQDRPPAFRPDQAGGSIGGFGKKLTPTKAFTKKQQKQLVKRVSDQSAKEAKRSYELSRKGFQSPVQIKLENIRRTGSPTGQASMRYRITKKSDQRKISSQISSAKGGGGSYQSPIISGSKGGLKTKTDLKLMLKPTETKKTGVFKLKEKPAAKKTSQEARQREKLTPTQQRQVDYKTQVQQQTNPVYNNPSVAAKVKQQPDIFLTQQEVSNLSCNMYYKPTGSVLPTKPFVVGSKVLAVGMGGKTLVELSPALLPKKEQNEIELLPEDQEVEIQKVIEEKQTLSPEEISDLAQQTQPKTITTPLEEEERQRVRQSPLPDEQEAQILTKEKKEDVNPFEEPFEDQLEDVGLADDLEDDTDIVEEPEETERVSIPEPDVDRPEVEQIEIGGEIDLEEEIATEDETQFEPLSEQELDTDVEVATDTATEQEAITPEDFSSDFEPEQTTKKKPEKEVIDQAVIPTPTSTQPPPPPPPKPKRPRKKFKFEGGKNGFPPDSKGKRPNIVNFKTRKGFFQANFKKGTVQAAPEGITLDTNKGFREDSMKVITRTEAATKFKTRRDPLKALERKGII